MPTITTKIAQTRKWPNIAESYGPFASLQAAMTYVENADIKCAGLTVGIDQPDGSIKEYWLKPVKGQLQFVEKQEAGGTDIFDEDIQATDAQRLQALANVSNQTANSTTGKMGYKVLNPSLSFESQVTAENTIYDICDVFDMDGGNISIPANSTLKFNGGKIANASIILNNTRLDGNVKFEKSNVQGTVANDIIMVDWFCPVGDGVSDDSESLLNAVRVLKRNGGTLVFGVNQTYKVGDGIQDLVNDPEMTSHTGYSYIPAEESNKLYHWVLHYNDGVGDEWNAGDRYRANIGRDITLRFLGCTNLIIEGNGSTIVSDEHNGICKHNAIMFFGACDDVTMRNLNIDGKRYERVTNADVYFNDWAPSNYSEAEYVNLYGKGIYESWKDGKWVDSENYGGALRASLYFTNCKRIKMESVVSDNSMMDGVFVSGSQSSFVSISNSRFSYNSRLGVGFGAGIGHVVKNCIFTKNGYYSNDTIDTHGSTNHGGVSAEFESANRSLTNYLQIDVLSSKFVDNDQKGVCFTYGSKYCACVDCTFNNNSVVLASNNDSLDNVVEKCLLINSTITFNQNGAVVRDNIIKFDNNYVPAFMAYHAVNVQTVTRPKTVQFVGNRIETLFNTTNVASLPTITDNTSSVKSPLCKDGNDVVYYDSRYTNGQGRVCIKGNVDVRNNYFHNVCPSVNASDQFVGHNANNPRFFGLDLVVKSFVNNIIKNDYDSVVWLTSGNNIQTDGYVSSSIDMYAPNQNVEFYDNTIDGFGTTVPARLPNISHYGLYSERPVFANYVSSANLSKFDGFSYYAIDQQMNYIWQNKSWYLVMQYSIGPIASIPSFSEGTKMGFLYYATDEKKWYVWNGSAYDDFNGDYALFSNGTLADRCGIDIASYYQFRHTDRTERDKCLVTYGKKLNVGNLSSAPTLSSDTYAALITVDIEDASMIRFLGPVQASGNTWGYAFYDSNNEWISGSSKKYTIGTTGKYDYVVKSIPSGAKYVKLICRYGNSSTNYLEGFYVIVDDVPLAMNGTVTSSGLKMELTTNPKDVAFKNSLWSYTNSKKILTVTSSSQSESVSSHNVDLLGMPYGIANAIYVKDAVPEGQYKGVQVYCNDISKEMYLSSGDVWKEISSDENIVVEDGVSTPVISVSNSSATITCATSGASIYYTLDGSNPTQKNTLYSSAIALSEGQTIKARAFKMLCDSSDIASYTN